MVLPDSHKIPRVPWYLGVQPGKSHHFSSTGLAPSVVGLSRTVRLSVTFVTFRSSQHSDQVRSHNTGRTTHADFHAARFRLFPVRSPLLRESLLFSFPQGTEMFHFPWFTLIPYVFRYESGHITGQRLPDSGISGSQSGCDYPKLIAASHALHRLLTPRHSPCTLSSLTINF